MTPTDNKAPREFWLLEAKNRNRGVRYYARLKDGDELLRPNLNSSWLIRNVIEVIEKSAYDKLQAELDELKAEKKKWRFRDSHDYTEELEKDLMELQTVRDRLERAESLLRRCGKYLDENVAFTGCEGSVYEFDDDQFGMLMFYRDEINDYFAEAEK